MHLLIVILKKVELIDQIIKELAEVGVPGGTIIDTTGMASVLENMDDLPIFGMLRRVLNESAPEEREAEKMLLFVLKDEELENTKDIVRNVIGDLNTPNTGIMFAVPVSFVEGLGA